MKSKNLSVVIIDCYDSFTYNLYHYLEPHCNKLTTYRVNDVQLDICNQFNAIVLSPGPGLPSDYPILKNIILTCNKPIFGICLGLQAIVETFGEKLINLPDVWHGIARETFIDNNDPLFVNLPQKILTARYHSWVAHAVPPGFKIIAKDKDGYIMGISHCNLPIKAVQFHPESILTEFGKEIIINGINFLP